MWGPSVVGAHEGSRKEEVSVGGMQNGLTHTDTKRKASGVHTGGERKLGWVTGALRGERAGVEIKEQISAMNQQIVMVCRARKKPRLGQL